MKNNILSFVLFLCSSIALMGNIMSIIEHKMKFPAISLAFSIMIYGGIIIYIAENRKKQ